MNLDVLSDAQDTNKNAHRWSRRAFVLYGLVPLAALAFYAVLSRDPWFSRNTGLPASFQLDLQEQVVIDPDQLHYQLHSQLELPFQQARAISTGPRDEIFVAGDRAVHVFTHDGQAKNVIQLDDEASCIAVGNAGHVEPGRLYVGLRGGVQVFHADGQPRQRWQLPAAQAVLTCIALGENDVFVADAGNRRVWRFDAQGQHVGQIGAPDSDRQDHVFVIPSPYFDVVVGGADLVHVANPGKLQVATFTFDGDFGSAWGNASSALSGFFGCCNPSHLAMLPDGRFVTSEKGIPRVKIYSPRGEFESVVAGPQQLGVDQHVVGDPRSTEANSVFDIAVDRQGRVLVLDANHSRVLIFVRKERTAARGDNV